MNISKDVVSIPKGYIFINQILIFLSLKGLIVIFFTIGLCLKMRIINNMGIFYRAFFPEFKFLGVQKLPKSLIPGASQ